MEEKLRQFTPGMKDRCILYKRNCIDSVYGKTCNPFKCSSCGWNKLNKRVIKVLNNKPKIIAIEKKEKISVKININPTDYDEVAFYSRLKGICKNENK